MHRKHAFKWLCFLILMLAIPGIGGDTLRSDNSIRQLARPHLFSVLKWELGHVPKKWLHELKEQFSGSDSPQDEIAQIREYFRIVERINATSRRLSTIRAGVGPQRDLNSAREELKELRPQQAAIKASAERALERLLSEALLDAALSHRVFARETVWPPVDLHLSRVPRVLIVSPRNRIQLMETHLLDPAITDQEIEVLEKAVGSRDLSGLVEKISGVATYPSLIPDTHSLQSVLRTAAHEWVHHFLFFHPLGQAYWDSSTMRTVNETVADLVGNAVGNKVYVQHFAATSEMQRQTMGGTSEATFDFGKEMRETRVVVDRLLEDGRTYDAETYMEQRRLFMAEHGYLFRKLNQAFFAFYGTYADRPGSTDPIGVQLRDLYDRSSSIKDFLFGVARFSSYDTMKSQLAIKD